MVFPWSAQEGLSGGGRFPLPPRVVSVTGFCSGFALGRVLLLALRWFASVRVCSGLRSRFPQSASVLSPLVMWLNNAIYAIWLLSGNVMTDQATLDRAAFRRDEIHPPSSLRGKSWVNQTLPVVSRSVATVGTVSTERLSVDICPVRVRRAPIVVDFVLDFAHFDHVGNSSTWNPDNNFACISPSLAPPRPGASPQGHLMHSILSPWPPRGWSKIGWRFVADHFLRLLDLLVNEILRGEWAPRLIYPFL